MSWKKVDDNTSDNTEENNSVACVVQDVCPICLENFSDKTFVKTCFHAFCFTCIVQWSQITQSCPICKATFQALIHDVKSFEEYKTFLVNPTPAENRKIERRNTVPTRSRSRAARLNKRKPATSERRKAVYLTGLRAQPPAASSDRIQRVRNIESSFFKRNPAAVHRLLPWITRDIKVLLGEDHVEFMLQLIISMVDKVNIDSEEFADHLKPFLFGKTDHFVHELCNFAKSPLDMVAYDNSVSYGFASTANESNSVSIRPQQEYTEDHRVPENEEMQQKIWFELNYEVENTFDQPTRRVDSQQANDDALSTGSETSDAGTIDQGSSGTCTSSPLASHTLGQNDTDEPELTVPNKSSVNNVGKGKRPLNKMFKPKAHNIATRSSVVENCSKVFDVLDTESSSTGGSAQLPEVRIGHRKWREGPVKANTCNVDLYVGLEIDSQIRSKISSRKEPYSDVIQDKGKPLHSHNEYRHCSKPSSVSSMNDNAVCEDSIETLENELREIDEELKSLKRLLRKARHRHKKRRYF